MLLTTLRRRACYLAAVGAVCVTGFLGLSTGLSAPASANGATVPASAGQLSTEIADLPAHTGAAQVVVVRAASARCSSAQLTALAPDDC
jgi:hypothetical protein